ncbi:MAG: hypothetical protein GKR97_03330 [Rhizobiaceae bacterium]|nr:hypothetical protein [Rhizobiaceae bacterium]
MTGCVTGSTDDLLSAQPVGQPQTTGQFPVIGRVPVAETAQMTPTQRSALKAELTRQAQAGQQQAQSNTETDYQREVAALKKLALEREEAMRKRIEGDDPAE